MTTNTRFPFNNIASRDGISRSISEASYQIHSIPPLAEAHSLDYSPDRQPKSVGAVE